MPSPAAPLHRRISDELARRVADGRFPRGAQLPTQAALCAELGISRVTLRKALATLAQLGIVESFQGRGTFVTAQRLAEPPNTLVSFSQLARTGGLAATATVLAQVVRRATIAEGEAFRIAPGAPLFELERRRLLDGLPVALTRSVVPLAVAPSMPELDWRSASLFDALVAAGAAPVRSDLALEAQSADHRLASLLDLVVGAPVLVAVSTSYALDERVVEQSRLVYRGDRYRFRTTLATAGGPAIPLAARG